MKRWKSLLVFVASGLVGLVVVGALLAAVFGADVWPRVFGIGLVMVIAGSVSILSRSDN